MDRKWGGGVHVEFSAKKKNPHFASPPWKKAEFYSRRLPESLPKCHHQMRREAVGGGRMATGFVGIVGSGSGRTQRGAGHRQSRSLAGADSRGGVLNFTQHEWVPDVGKTNVTSPELLFDGNVGVLGGLVMPRTPMQKNEQTDGRHSYQQRSATSGAST